MAAGYTRIFTLEVDGRPTLAFEAARAPEAKQICKEVWLQEDLDTLTSRGVPLRRNKGSKVLVRPATAEEAVKFADQASQAKPSDELFVAYMVGLDAWA